MNKIELYRQAKILHTMVSNIISEAYDPNISTSRKVSPEGIETYNSFARKFNEVYTESELFIFQKYENPNYVTYPKSQELLSQLELAITILNCDGIIDEKNPLESSTKVPMVLISHANDDRVYIEHIVKLFENIGLNNTNMVCSSVPGYGIPLGNDIYEWLANKFIELELYVVFILSDSYYSSVPCLNEMGAAWITKNDYTLILLPGFDFTQIRGTINPNKIAINLDSDEDELKQRLNELKDSLLEKFGINKVPDIRWEHFRTDFINSIKKIKTK